MRGLPEAWIDIDDDVAHNSRRALVKDSAGVHITVDDERTRCVDCVKPFRAIEDIRAQVERGDRGVKDVLDDSEKKFKLFIGHKLRCNCKDLHLKKQEWKSSTRRR